MQQQPLPLYKTADKTFDDFIVGTNQHALDSVKHWATGSGPWFLLIWGPESVGKSHLMQAALRRQVERKNSMMYLPLESLRQLGPEVLDGLGDVAAIGIDNIDVVYGDKTWEVALFNLFNTLSERGHRLLISASSNPKYAALKLVDLQSRLCSGLSYQLEDINDEEKKIYLARRANLSGMTLPDNVAEYILTHHSRDLRQLSLIFERLDEAALQANRSLTVPFVREVLATSD